MDYPVVDLSNSEEMTTENDFFAVPEYPQDNPIPSAKAASEDAFYAVSAVSQDPVSDFLKTQADLLQTGESDLVKQAKSQWYEEQDSSAKEAISALMADTSVSVEQKKAMLNTYAAGGYTTQDLRDRYIQKQVASDNGVTIDDTIAQENTGKAILDSVANMKQEESLGKNISFVEDVVDYAKGTGAIVSKLAASAFVGWAGIYDLIKNRDSTKATAFMEKATPIIQEYGYNPTGAKAKKAEEKMSNLLHYLSIPAEWVGNKTFEITGSPTAATAAGIILDPVAIVGGSLLRGRPHIPAGSPLDATITANKINAGKIAETALADETGKVAEALGTDKGTILSEMALPKLPEEIIKDNPDLAQKLIDLDEKADYSFNLHKLDPNISDIEAHTKDMETILAVMKENGSPYYQQANSTFTSPGVNIFEGKAVYGRSADGNYVTKEGADYALSKMEESISKLPEDLQGTLAIVEKNGEYVIEHTWRKEYAPVDDLIFGADSVKSTFAGININGLKHTPIGKWLFPTGVFPRKYEAGKERSVDRGLKQSNDLMKPIRENIASTPYKKELHSLVLEADRTGIEYFSKGDISSRFPELSHKSVSELFDTHVIWRRIAQYEHRILNNSLRNDMLEKEFKTAFNEDGSFLANVREKIEPSEVSTIREVYDLNSKTIIQTKNFVKNELGKIVDEDGRQLVRLHEPVAFDTARYNYGLLGAKHKVDVLQAQPLPRITGWSPRMHSNHFYIDAIPKSLSIDGIKISDVNVLREHRKTLSGAKTQYEADKIKANLQLRHPDKEVVVRPERLDSYGNIRDEYQTSAELYAHARKRGEGIANTEMQDPLQSLMKTAQAISHQNTMGAWEQATKKAFTKAYGEFLHNGEFPSKRGDLRPLVNMTKEEAAKFQSAVALYENYARFKTYGYATDTAYKGALHKVADMLEGIHIPGNLLRGLAKHEFPLVAIPKKLGSIMYINLNVPRQWFIQPQQTLELMVISPKTFAQSAQNLFAITTHLLGESPKLGVMGKMVQYLTKKMTPDEVELGKSIQAIKDSGIIDSIDSNVLVNGIFHDTHQLMTTASEKAAGALKATVEVPSKIGRSLGYDPSELFNKTGIWLQMKELWKQRNPGKEWDTPATKEWIAHEVHNYSGNMNKAGNLPYQSGMLSPFFQFSAIGHKMFMNLMQNNATALSATQRWKLGALRASMMGVKYGLPAGGLIYALVEKNSSPETKKELDVVKLGLSNYLVNEWLNTYYPNDRDTKTDLAVSKSISPYGESGLPYADMITETLKLIDGKESSNPRYPLFGVSNSLFDLSKKWETLWYNKDYSSADKFEIGFREGLMATSGYNNWFKAQYMIGTGEKMNKLGNPNGLTYTVQEGWALVFGIQSNKDEWLYSQLETFTDNAKNIKDTAKDIYTQINYLDNMFNPDGTYNVKLDQMSHALNIAESNEGFTPEAKQQVMEEILHLASQDKTAKSNLIMKWILESRQLSQESYNKSLDVLSQDPSKPIQDLVQSLKDRNI